MNPADNMKKDQEIVTNADEKVIQEQPKKTIQDKIIIMGASPKLEEMIREKITKMWQE